MVVSSARSWSAIPTSTCRWSATASPTTTSASTTRPPTPPPKPKRGKTAAASGPTPTRFHPSSTVTAANLPRQRRPHPPQHLPRLASNTKPATPCPSPRVPPRQSQKTGPTLASGCPQTQTNATTASARTTARHMAILVAGMKVCHVASAEGE